MKPDTWSSTWRTRHRSGRIFAGLVILTIGVLELLKAIGYLIPSWIYSWPMLLIVIGIYIAIKHRLRNPASYLLVLLGLCFLILDNMSLPFHVDNLVWPAIIIVVGLSILLKNRHPRGPFPWEGCSGPGAEPSDHPGGAGHPSGPGTGSGSSWDPSAWSSGWTVPGHAESGSEGDRVDLVAVFGGSRRVVLSKNFKGGEGVAVCGGLELNLLQADMEQTAVLDLVAICGGVKLLVPAHWEVRSNVVHLFSGMDDKRSQQPGSTLGPAPGKVLLLTGTCLFAGIEIRSF